MNTIYLQSIFMIITTKHRLSQPAMQMWFAQPFFFFKNMANLIIHSLVFNIE